MRLTYKVRTTDDKEVNIEDDFCRDLRASIRLELNNTISTDKLNSYKDLVLETTAIDWINKPKDIDMEDLFSILIDNIVCTRTKNRVYSIKFSDNLFPNTYNTIDSIVRFLDKGNEMYPGMHLFSSVFNKYSKNIKLYWEFFILRKLNRVTISEVLVVK